ncbi:quinon protein alcohol dehydrogenase-like superfamily [Suillus subalutaceus]|uniref:quinon protein alcohol dehydrogenase-like superfamily n=1 Tax=Suillus subalutaceus TaxID=48586 RepID=UPI001B883F9A|nr:quinon protein alcohol dehydrogenase-like superfamily [Suillus subalutaceus]KAG1859349.1 quinon protein alcohol dehydrogenase-like superfamily [Suillus subalutaceus]
MASMSTKVATTKSNLTPSMTLKGHGSCIYSLSYFPDGQRMISGSYDKTTRQWDLKVGKEIEEARDVFEKNVYAVAVSRNGRWIVTGGGELKACEVETGIMKTFEGHSREIICIDISAGNTLLASKSIDETARIWNLETGKLVAGIFKSIGEIGAARQARQDRVKIATPAVKSGFGTCLEVWDVQSQKLDVRIGTPSDGGIALSLVFWTNKNKTIIAAFEFSFTDQDDDAKTIYEFDAVTLGTVGAPFEGHTKSVGGLALSFDDALLASASDDLTIKLWAFESRQLLASFDVQNAFPLILSSDSRQLVYTKDDNKICICDTPPNILAQARLIARKKSTIDHLLHSDATRRPPAGHRRPPIFAIPIALRPLPTRDPQQSTFLRLSEFLRFSPRANAVPVRHIQPRDPLDVPATLPLPSSLSSQAATRFDYFEISSPPPRSNGVVQSLQQHFSFLVPKHSHGPPVVEVAPDRKVTRLLAASTSQCLFVDLCALQRLLAAKLPEYNKVDDTRHPSSQQATVPQENNTADIDSLPDVHWVKAFLCYYSCLSHGRLRMPPRWRLERVDIPRQDGAASSSRGGTHDCS